MYSSFYRYNQPAWDSAKECYHALGILGAELGVYDPDTNEINNLWYCRYYLERAIADIEAGRGTSDSYMQQHALSLLDEAIVEHFVSAVKGLRQQLESGQRAEDRGTKGESDDGMPSLDFLFLQPQVRELWQRQYRVLGGEKKKKIDEQIQILVQSTQTLLLQLQSIMVVIGAPVIINPYEVEEMKRLIGSIFVPSVNDGRSGAALDPLRFMQTLRDARYGDDSDLCLYVQAFLLGSDAPALQALSWQTSFYLCLLLDVVYGQFHTLSPNKQGLFLQQYFLAALVAGIPVRQVLRAELQGTLHIFRYVAKNALFYESLRQNREDLPTKVASIEKGKSFVAICEEFLAQAKDIFDSKEQEKFVARVYPVQAPEQYTLWVREALSVYVFIREARLLDWAKEWPQDPNEQWVVDMVRLLTSFAYGKDFEFLLEYYRGPDPYVPFSTFVQALARVVDMNDPQQLKILTRCGEMARRQGLIGNTEDLVVQVRQAKADTKDQSEFVRPADQGVGTNERVIYERILAESEAVGGGTESGDRRRARASDIIENFLIRSSRQPVTAMTEILATHRKDFSRLDRTAAVTQASEMMAILMGIKIQDITADARAKLFAVTVHLQNHGWGCEQAEYIYNKIDQLQKGALVAEDKERWFTAAQRLQEIGWLEGAKIDQGVVVGSFRRWVNRRIIASLQNVAITGCDIDLIKAHRAIVKKIDPMNPKLVTTVTYRTAADELFKNGQKFGDVQDVAQFKKRYEQYADFFEIAMREFRDSALRSGQQDMGYNQDFDEDFGTYRFQTHDEGETKMYDERLKHAVRNLLNTDQYHSNGTLDLDTGVMDDFTERALAVSLGRATKLVEFSDIPLRSLLSHFYLHKDEKAVTKDGFGVVGGGHAKTKIAADLGIAESAVTDDQIRQHILKRGVLAQVMAGNGGLGFGLAGSKAFNHVNEQDVLNGTIKLEIGGKQYTTFDELIGDLEKLVASAGALDGTEYAGQEERVRRQLGQALDTVKERRKRGSEKTKEAARSEKEDKEDTELGHS